MYVVSSLNIVGSTGNRFNHNRDYQKIRMKDRFYFVISNGNDLHPVKFDILHLIFPSRRNYNCSKCFLQRENMLGLNQAILQTTTLQLGTNNFCPKYPDESKKNNKPREV